MTPEALERKRLRDIAWVRANPEKRQMIRDRYRRSEKGLAHHRADVRRANQRKPRLQPVEQKMAYSKLLWALRSGKLVRPDQCANCLAVARPVAHHHKGYDHPLDVLWLCRPCHAVVHGQRKVAA